MNTDNIESFTPIAGNTLPSRIRTGERRGPTLASFFRQMDEEDLLREVSKFPVSERKVRLAALRKQLRSR